MYGAKDWLKNFSHWEIECKLFKDGIHMQISSSLQQLIAEEQRMLKRKFLLITRFFYSFTIFKVTYLSYKINASYLQKNNFWKNKLGLNSW